MSTTRVYILAKELGVKSSAIVKKCQDEQLDVKNHMSTISAGLAATIREWFSEGDNVTTVETSEKVNLAKVRVKKKAKRKAAPRKKAKSEKDAQASDLEPPAEATAVTEPPEASPEAPAPAEPKVKGPIILPEPEP
ncbi:MAG: translation initiation factor IF-2 N-terminal domain-containing protein, partial [Phycisphaerales bacterium]